jgi:Sigma-70, region 4
MRYRRGVGYHRYHPSKTIPIRRASEALAYLYAYDLPTDHWRPQCRLDCMPLTENCPWCCQKTVMALSLENEQAFLSCPLCKRRVTYIVGLGGEGGHFEKYVEGTPTQRVGSDEGDIHPNALARFRPCRFSGCRHHLYLDVNASGGIVINFPELDLDEMGDTCALDVADRGGHTLDEVGQAMHLTRERIRQIERGALGQFPASMVRYLDDDQGGA